MHIPRKDVIKVTIYIIILAVFIVLAILIRYNINKKQTN